MTKTKRSTNCSIEVGNVKQHLLLWRYDVQTDDRDCHGNAASTTLRDRIPSTNPGAEPPRDARDSGSARSHSTHLETSSSDRP